MGTAIARSTRGAARLLRVAALAELAYLVKEREVIFGRPGRVFFVGEHQEISLDIHTQFNGFDVCPIGSASANATRYFTDQQIGDTFIGDALRDGLLFTLPSTR